MGLHCHPRAICAIARSHNRTNPPASAPVRTLEPRAKSNYQPRPSGFSMAIPRGCANPIDRSDRARKCRCCGVGFADSGSRLSIICGWRGQSGWASLTKFDAALHGSATSSARKWCSNSSFLSLSANRSFCPTVKFLPDLALVAELRRCYCRKYIPLKIICLVVNPTSKFGKDGVGQTDQAAFIASPILQSAGVCAVPRVKRRLAKIESCRRQRFVPKGSLAVDFYPHRTAALPPR